MTVQRAVSTRVAFWIVALGVTLKLGTVYGQGRSGAETEEERIFNEAEAAFEEERFDFAKKRYETAITMNPGRVTSFVKLGTIECNRGEYQEAFAHLNQAEKLSPQDLNLKIVLGLCLYRADRKEEAIAYLKDVAGRRPEAHEAQLLVGQHYAQSEPERAIGALDNYFRYRPEERRRNDPLAALHRGTAYLLRGRLKEARRDLELAYEGRGKDPQAALMFATVLLSLGEYKESLALQEPYVAEIQKRPALAFNLAQGYLRTGRPLEASRMAERYVSLRPQDPRGQVLLGDIFLLQGTGKESLALRHYEEAQRMTERGGSSPSISLDARLARAHLQAKDADRALAFAETGLSSLRRREAVQKGEKGVIREGEEEELLAILLSAELSRSQVLRPQLVDQALRLSVLLPRDPQALLLSGNVALSAGNLERARKLYGDVIAAGGNQATLKRARLGLSRTLQRMAQGLLGQERPDLAGAQSLLEQAQPLDEGGSATRNLALLYLMQNREKDALRLLTPLSGSRDPYALRIQARAHLLLGQTPQALSTYERAVQEIEKLGDAGKVVLAEVQGELAGRYLQAERYDDAVTLLERAANSPHLGYQAGKGVHPVLRNLALAYVARGRARLAEQEALLSKNPAAPSKQAEGALDDLQKALVSSAERGGLQPGKKEAGTVYCLAALAAVQSARYSLGRELVGKAQGEGGCEMAAPYDRLGLDLLLAYISYRDTTNLPQREKALRSLSKLLGRAGTGTTSQPLQTLLRSLIRSTHEMLAYDYYTLNKPPRAYQMLKAAQKQLPQGVEPDSVLQHNLAVADLAEGKPAGEKVLERLSGKPPESLVNLGILRDRRGEPKKALEYYKRALERGAKVNRLREWIDLKYRLLGEGPDGKPEGDIR